MTTLFSPFQLGDIALDSRLVMAPLTRNRAVGGIPNALMATYYRQRANPATGAGLIITEASPVCPMGHGYLDTPGIYSPEQVRAWRQVTDAVHAEGGKIVVQLWHVGRISHTSLLPGGAAPESATATPARGKTYIEGGFAPVSAPRALRTEEIPALVQHYRHAARCAMDAGFDGVEIHAANGYLIEQFLRDSINDRSDAYGGSPANRVRFALEVTQAIVAEIGAGRTGIRLSPITPANDAAQDSDAQGLYGLLAQGLAPLKLAYVHVVEGATGGPRDLSEQGVAPFDYAALRAQAQAPWMVNNGYDGAMAEAAIASGAADVVALGKAFIANPDLGARLKAGAPLNELQLKTLYGGGPEGYVDYSLLGG